MDPALHQLRLGTDAYAGDVAARSTPRVQPVGTHRRPGHSVPGLLTHRHCRVLRVICLTTEVVVVCFLVITSEYDSSLGPRWLPHSRASIIQSNPLQGGSFSSAPPSLRSSSFGLPGRSALSLQSPAGPHPGGPLCMFWPENQQGSRWAVAGSTRLVSHFSGLFLCWLTSRILKTVISTIFAILILGVRGKRVDLVLINPSWPEVLSSMSLAIFL